MKNDKMSKEEQDWAFKTLEQFILREYHHNLSDEWVEEMYDLLCKLTGRKNTQNEE